MSLLEIWNTFTVFISEKWTWLINANLIEGAKNIALIFLVVVVVIIATRVLETIINAYNKKIVILYKRYPKFMNMSLIVTIVVSVLSFILFTVSLLGVLTNYLWLFAMFSAIAFLIYLVIRKPEEQPNNALK